MRKLITSGMFVVGMVSIPVSLTTRQAVATAVPDYRTDPRLETLRSFFHKGECPAEHYSEAFLEAADHNELDWRLLPSLSFVESTGGKHAPHNNLFGWDSGRAYFPTPVACIHAVGFQLAHAAQYREKNLDRLLATYNPDVEYARTVKFVMRQISPTK